jgi:hypothetical protein
MQADGEAADYISRAKAKLAGWLAGWRDMWTAQQQEDRFAKCTADELICIAETGKELDGRELTTGVLYALHGAWQCTFGEGLGTRAGGMPEPMLGAHPPVATGTIGAFQ